MNSLYTLEDLAAKIDYSPAIGTINAVLPLLENIRDFSHKMKENFVREFKQRHREFHGFAVDRRRSLKSVFTQDENYLAWLLVIFFKRPKPQK